MQYEILKSGRAKHIRIVVHPDGRVVVTKPAHMSIRDMESWVKNREEWVQESLSKFERRSKRFEKKHGTPIELPKLRKGSKAYNDAVDSARTLSKEKLAYFNAIYRLPYGTVSIRNQKTRWGSCSAKGNLSFNYRIAQLPTELADYLVVHELCHIQEHNHSAKFWAQVARTIPDYIHRRNKLHRYRF